MTPLRHINYTGGCVHTNHDGTKHCERIPIVFVMIFARTLFTISVSLFFRDLEHDNTHSLHSPDVLFEFLINAGKVVPIGHKFVYRQLNDSAVP